MPGDITLTQMVASSNFVDCVMVMSMSKCYIAVVLKNPETSYQLQNN